MNRSFGIAIAASGILAAAACVQKPATASTPSAQPQASMAGDSGMRRGMRGEGRERMEEMMFQGITLSAAQQAQVDSLRERHRGEMHGMDPRNNPADRQKMMQMMPLVMGVMFAFFPAGLVLYWVTNGALGLLQQWWMLRRFGGEPAKA